MKYLLLLPFVLLFSCNKEQLYVCKSSIVENNGLVFYTDKSGIKDAESRMPDLQCEKTKDEPNCWECALYGSWIDAKGKTNIINEDYSNRRKLDTCGLNWAEMRSLESGQYSIKIGDTTFTTQTCRLKQ